MQAHTKTGAAIVGTVERVTATLKVDPEGFWRADNGSLVHGDPIDGGDVIDWDSTEQVTVAGERLFVDDTGAHVKESEIVLEGGVSITPLVQALESIRRGVAASPETVITVDEANHRDVASAIRTLNGVIGRTPVDDSQVRVPASEAQQLLMAVQQVHWQRHVGPLHSKDARRAVVTATDALSEALEDPEGSSAAVRAAAVAVCQAVVRSEG